MNLLNARFWGSSAAVDAVTEQDLVRRLDFDNPWWALKSGHRVRFRHPPQRRPFAAFAAKVTAPVEAGAAPLVLAGPSGAGKTILLRQALAASVRAGVPPTRIAYLSLATPVYGTVDLTRLVGLFLDRFAYKPTEKFHLFLDDLDYLPDGLAQLTALARHMPQARMVAALSSGAPAVAPGTAAGLDVTVLPPLTFAEFLSFRDAEGALTGRLPGPDGAADLAAATLDALNDEFARYVAFGGFPDGIAVAGAPSADQPTPPGLVRDRLLSRVLHRDLPARHGVNEPQELARLFALLARNTGGELAYEDLAKAAGLAKNTLRKYLDYLEHAFLIRRVPRLNRDGRPFQRQVLFKCYLTSPTLYTALFGPVMPGEAAFARLVETAVVGQVLGGALAGRLAYASWRGGQVDLLVLAEDGKHPDTLFEFDWADSYAATPEGPETMTAFAIRTNPDAAMSLLTNRQAGPAKRGGLDVAMVPAALQAYWLGLQD